MKKAFLLWLVVLVVFSLLPDARAGNPVKVEVLYMNHGPMQPTIKQIKEVFSKYAEKTSVSWYDVETPEAQQFMLEKGVHEHTPVIIWINGSQTVKLGPREVKFTGFPTGSGSGFFQGDWAMKDLKAALDQATANK